MRTSKSGGEVWMVVYGSAVWCCCTYIPGPLVRPSGTSPDIFRRIGPLRSCDWVLLVSGRFICVSLVLVEGPFVGGLLLVQGVDRAVYRGEILLGVCV